MVSADEITFQEVSQCEDDARLIMEWRNDPETLRWSFHQEPKVWDSFYSEFCSEYFIVPDLPPLFASVRGEPVAFVRFRPADHPSHSGKRCCDISINVAPDKRGQGLGPEVLKAAHRFVGERHYHTVIAEILKENGHSHSAFLKSGYNIYEFAEKKVEDTGQSFEVLRYMYDVPGEPVPKKVFIIAEAGSNWRMGEPGRDLQMAKALIDVAAEAGADAVKFQVFRPETTYVPNAGASNYLLEAGISEDISSIFNDLAMPYEMLEVLAEYCETKNIEFMCSPFSQEDFERVNPLVKRHKIASYEISHLRLLEAAGLSGKPLILSTGASTIQDIRWAADCYRLNGGKNLTLLQCTAKYPAESRSVNIKAMQTLADEFNVAVGLSDHSQDPILAPVMAVALGAEVIEKHFTLDRNLPGPDHSFAITPGELRQMVTAIREAELMRGSGMKLVQSQEEELRHYCHRSVQAIREIKQGELLQEGKNIDILRPGNQKMGVHPRFIVDIQGKMAKRDIPLGAGIQSGDWN